MSKGELVITLSDNTVSNLGVVVGAKGDKGETGATGQQGAQGEKGDTGAQGEQGISVTGAEINSNGEFEICCCIFEKRQRIKTARRITRLYRYNLCCQSKWMYFCIRQK